MHGETVVDGLEEPKVWRCCFEWDEMGEDVEGGVEEELEFESIARVGREEGDVEGVVLREVSNGREHRLKTCIHSCR